MARDTSPQCKQCRREGQKLFLKGERCLTDKCGVERVEVHAKGAGSGRDTAIRSLQAAGLQVTTVKDVSPQAHNGCRPKKRRRP